ncbi:alpha/beta-hydrolase [Coniochaeta ligniaria NRRL 30616]|uniref:Alpha/beta-hydrolase n=1 Tax=Coniochaeta ligniaria NRRL 30616 TaxID=1408157 RepID=A0A1J7JY41_9PEZI|nr:alpha/beta-hydrolase [Coniochaeta ligniaria NRRL 30616]
MTQPTLTEGDHFFSAEGITFHYRVGGSSGPIFIAHSVGWGMPGSYLWNGLGPHLEKSHTVVYLEPRGNGQSSQPADEGAMSSRIMAADIEHLRQHLGLDSIPVLFGHSNGACIALRYAEQYPDRVQNLILVSAEVQDFPSNDNLKTWAAKRKDDPVYGPAVAGLARAFKSPPQTDAGFAQMMDTILPWYFSDVRHVDTLRGHMSPDVTPPRVWPFLRQGPLDKRAENKCPHVADGGLVKARTLVVWGAEDAMCSVDAGRAVAGAVTGARLVVFEGCGHFPWIEEGEGFFREVDAFLGSD